MRREHRRWSFAPRLHEAADDARLHLPDSVAERQEIGGSERVIALHVKSFLNGLTALLPTTAARA